MPTPRKQVPVINGGVRLLSAHPTKTSRVDEAKLVKPRPSWGSSCCRRCETIDIIAGEMAALRGTHLLAVLRAYWLALTATAALVSGGGNARFEMIHAMPGASVADRARNDGHRHSFISAWFRRRAAEVGRGSMPLLSGAYTGTGE